MHPSAARFRIQQIGVEIYLSVCVGVPSLPEIFTGNIIFFQFELLPLNGQRRSYRTSLRSFIFHESEYGFSKTAGIAVEC